MALSRLDIPAKLLQEGLSDVEAPAAVVEFLAARDAAAEPLQPGCQSSVLWTPKLKEQRAPLVVVFVHGFSACPREVEPVDARVADALGAHLLRFRLSGHGLRPLDRAGLGLLTDSTKSRLQSDIATAYALARQLGERIIFIGCSMGGALSSWLCAQPWAKIEALVLIAPCFQLTAIQGAAWSVAKLLLAVFPRSWIQALIVAATGAMHSFPPESDEVAQMWTYQWPKAAVVNIMELLAERDAVVHPKLLKLPVLALSNPGDPVVAFAPVEKFMKALPSGELELVADSEDPHNITGRAKSPSTVDRFVRQIVGFLMTKLKLSVPAESALRNVARKVDVRPAWPASS
eukprot:TRINITY_DN31857_c0_g1_i1.p1 TRINITY_DN31857_c0_g1~~TRINITY_DN31857_c0_g1_i1.p1  ORF type:complete len:346 (-),score=57.32 TRINITY_DN31857_c0_g1_i1:60-1097(-)